MAKLLHKDTVPIGRYYRSLILFTIIFFSTIRCCVFFSFFSLFSSETNTHSTHGHKHTNVSARIEMALVLCGKKALIVWLGARSAWTLVGIIESSEIIIKDEQKKWLREPKNNIFAFRHLAKFR